MVYANNYIIVCAGEGGVVDYLYFFMHGHVKKEPSERTGGRVDSGAEKVGQQEIQLFFVEVMAAVVLSLCDLSHKHGHQIVTSVRVFAPFLHQRFVYVVRVFHALDHFKNRFPVLRHHPETTPRDVCIPRKTRLPVWGS